MSKPTCKISCGSTACKEIHHSLTHVRGIALCVFRLQVVQHTVMGFGRQIQVVKEHCFLPIYCVCTDDAGREFTTIAELKNQGGVLASDGFVGRIFYSDLWCGRWNQNTWGNWRKSNFWFLTHAVWKYTFCAPGEPGFVNHNLIQCFPKLHSFGGVWE